MSEGDEYRRNAKYAQDQADRTVNEKDKASWLRVAASWLGLIPKGQAEKDSDAFDAKLKDKGTGQPESESSH
jgi:hypothetical protein